jgi:hypothetical protein
MDPTRLVDAGRQPVFEIAEERVDRGESGVSCSRRVAAFFLQMLQERQDERRIELFKLDLRGRDREPTGGEANEQSKAVCVSLVGVLTCLALLRQVLAQESAQVRGESVHSAPPASKASPASAICPFKSGVPCKYQ